MPRREDVRSKESTQLYIKGEGSLHFNNLDFSIFITSTTFIGVSFRFFSSMGIGSPVPVCNHNFDSPLVFHICFFDQLAVKVRGGSVSMEGSPFWTNTLCHLDERGKRMGGSAPLLFSTFLGGAA